MVFKSQSVERKELAILKILSDSPEPLGARVIAHHLKNHGFELGEMAVRYHLKLMDERGFTELIGRRDGRMLTNQGIEEVKSALVQDKVGFINSRIDSLAFRTSFDCQQRRGLIPVNVSLFSKEKSFSFIPLNFRQVRPLVISSPASPCWLRHYPASSAGASIAKNA